MKILQKIGTSEKKCCPTLSHLVPHSNLSAKINSEDCLKCLKVNKPSACAV